MTDRVRIPELESLLDSDHLDGLVGGVMGRIRGERAFSVVMARLWPGALAAAAAGVLLTASLLQPIESEPASQPSADAPALDARAVVGTALGVPRELMERATARNGVTMEEAFVLMRPVGP